MNEQEDWDRLEKDFDSSEDEDDNNVNNFIWYHHDQDPDNYFTMSTRCHDFFERDSQVLCCYGRRSNTYLMPAYGFCLQNNKYNSLRFKVWVDFTQDEKAKMEAIAKRKKERATEKEKKRVEKEQEKANRKKEGQDDEYDSEYDSSEEESEDEMEDGLDNRVQKGICLKAN